MKKTFIVLVVLFSTPMTMASEIFALRDWKAFKGEMTPLGKKGCLAETIAEVDNNGVMEKWSLQVLKLEAGNGDYTAPIIISFPQNQPTEAYYEAVAKTDKEGSGLFNMTLLQPKSGDTSIVAGRIKDRLTIIRRLRRDNIFSVSFMDKRGPVRTAPFSLSGSSKTIEALEEECP